ncbi:MAG: sterol desaturase family protein [Pleurocapsa sp. CRU_1_2]|nr:sterol desaturase family protein [Pleurocapsa sp. CRU_1_2]
MELFDTIFKLIQYTLEGLIIYGIFILIERLRPAEKNQPFKHIFFNLQFVLVFVFIPLGVLFQIEPKELGLIGFIDVLWLQINHLNLRLELGIFKSVIVGPQHHRIHHSFALEHIDKNFAAFFPIWDILFGTYYPAKKGEFPPTGLTDKHNYNNLWEANILPFKEWLGARYLGRFKQNFIRKVVTIGLDKNPR